MSGENQMVEKKIILCAILAIALGIATVVPMAYLMAAQAQESNQVRLPANNVLSMLIPFLLSM